jgi:hypothetical protein
MVNEPYGLSYSSLRSIFSRTMEARLVILLACVSITLIVNTVIIFAIFKIFGSMASKATESIHEFQTSASTRHWLNTLQAASENAAKVSGSVRDQIVGFEPALIRMQAEHSERLAKADVRFRLVSRAILFSAEKIEKIVTWPIRNIQAAASVIKGVFEFIRGTESGSDASSRR